MDQAQNKGLISQLGDYAAHPFKKDMSLWGLFLTTGVVLVFVVIWTTILRSIAEAAQ